MVTSRRRLTALQDATVVSSNALTPGSGEVLARLAEAPARGAGWGCGVGEIPGWAGVPAAGDRDARRQLRHHPALGPPRQAAEMASAGTGCP